MPAIVSMSTQLANSMAAASAARRARIVPRRAARLTTRHEMGFWKYPRMAAPSAAAGSATTNATPANLASATKSASKTSQNAPIGAMMYPESDEFNGVDGAAQKTQSLGALRACRFLRQSLAKDGQSV